MERWDTSSVSRRLTDEVSPQKTDGSFFCFRLLLSVYQIISFLDHTICALNPPSTMSTSPFT